MSEWRQGWPVVLAGASGAGLSSLQTIALSLLIKPLSAEFGWTRSQIVVSVTITTFAALLLSPLVGALMDQIGARKVALFGVVAKTAALAAVALTTSAIWTWYALWVLVAITAPAANVVVWTKAVATRFVEQRGLALAVTMAGLSLTNGIFTLLASHILQEYGWRAVYIILSGVAFSVCFPLTWAFFYDAGDLAARGRPKARRPETIADYGMSRQQAFRSAKLWRLFLATMIISTSLGGLMVHLPSILDDLGVAAGMTAIIFSVAFGPCAILGRLTTGLLLDRLHGPLVVAVAFSMPACAALIFLNFGGTASLFLAAVCCGVALGAELEALAYLVSKYFGPRSYGAVYGLGFGLYSVGFGAGPLLAASFYDTDGFYRHFFILVAAGALLSVPLIATLGRYPVWRRGDAGTAEPAEARPAIA